jgi:NAD(P)-dependent dehydrogenase (short-subunit alcohol dehydrogenase family)
MTAVVSGGSRGIGLAVATLLAEQGGRVAVFGRSPAALDEAAESLRDAGARGVLALVADATDEASVAAAFATVADTWDALNVLVNAVGPSTVGRFEDLDDLAWQAAFADGVMSAVHCVRHGLPLLRLAPWARIVNLTALSTRHQNPVMIAYTAAKAALASMTKNLARTLAPEGILVNAVAPGPVLTPAVLALVQRSGGNPDDPADVDRVMAQRWNIDLGRVGLPREIAEAVVFCASPQNTYMTGAQLNVDGGTDFA